MLFSESLKKTDEFKKVYTCGRSYADRNIVVYVWKNGTDKNHLGISVSKKVGNSIVRHRFARLVREIYRLHENIFNSGLDIVVIARVSASSIGFYEVGSALTHLAKLHHVLKNPL